jgi:S1-C subfamily serine protease
MASFRGVVAPGNSGGPLVDTRGRVLATVFAQATGGGPRGGYGVPNSVVSANVADAVAARDEADTGPCAG